MLVHAWVPELFRGTGGIQTYTRFLLESMFVTRPDWSWRLFLKNDTCWKGLENSPANLKGKTFGHISGPARTGIYAASGIAAAMRQRPRLIIACHANFLPAVRWAGRMSGAKIVVPVHGVEVWGLKFHSAMARGLREAWRVLSVSEYTTGRIVDEAGVKREQVCALPNTFDEKRFVIEKAGREVRERFGIPANAKLLLTVNRLCASEPHRAYDVVLEALPQVIEEIDGLHWIVAGAGDDRARFEAEIRKRRLAGRVHLAGFVPDSELPDFYRTSDLFVMPGKLEGFGIVYLEAMGCGKPALGGCADGARDALRNGELGLLASPDDPAEVADTIVRHLQGESVNRLLYDAEALRAEMMKHYSRDAFRDRVDQLLNSLEEELP